MRGAGSREPQDHDRRAHLLVQDFRVLAQQRLGAQTRHQELEHEAARDEAADG
jgi:hypothetical protein